MNVIDDADGPLDPRIQVELENLNNATNDINQLEIALDEARAVYSRLSSDRKHRLKEERHKISDSCIEKARFYFEALQVAQCAKARCQHEAELFKRANEILLGAKDTVETAEKNYLLHKHEWNFDSAWQDSLNQATIKVMDAENQKAAHGREHQRVTQIFKDAEKKAQELEEKYRRSIRKSQHYFDMEAQYEQKLALQSEKVACLENSIRNAKLAYSNSLRALEEISNSIHEQRRDFDIVANGPREPGVGAELDGTEDSLEKELSNAKAPLSRVDSIADSSEAEIDDRDQDFEDLNQLKQRMDNLPCRSADGSEATSNLWELELQAGFEKLTALPCQDASATPTVPASLERLAPSAKKQDPCVNPTSSSSSSCNVRRTRSDSLSAAEEHLTLGSNEFPLLSMVSRSSISKDKSFSMVNLNDKQKLKSFLDKTALGDIQAISSERLAEARHKLIGKS